MSPVFLGSELHGAFRSGHVQEPPVLPSGFQAPSHDSPTPHEDQAVQSGAGRMNKRPAGRVGDARAPTGNARWELRVRT